MEDGGGGGAAVEVYLRRKFPAVVVKEVECSVVSLFFGLVSPTVMFGMAVEAVVEVAMEVVVPKGDVDSPGCEF